MIVDNSVVILYNGKRMERQVNKMALEPINQNKIKQELVNMIQAVPEGRLLLVKNLLESVLSQSLDPSIITLLTAPLDDEPLTEEDIEESEANWQAILRGEGVCCKKREAVPGFSECKCGSLPYFDCSLSSGA